MKPIDFLFSDNLKYDDILKHIKENFNILRLTEKDIAKSSGYFCKQDIATPLFGIMSADTLSLSTLYHELSHAIDFLNNDDPSRILENTFSMMNQSAVIINEQPYQFYTSTTAIKRECRTIAIQSKLSSQIMNIDEDLNLKKHIKEFGGALYLMEDFLNIDTPNNLSYTDKKKYRLDIIGDWISDYYEDYANNINYEESLKIIEKIRKNKISNQYLKKHTYYHFNVNEVIESLDLLGKNRINFDNLNQQYDLAYNNKTINVDEFQKKVINKAISLKSHPVTIKLKNNKFSISENDEILFLASLLNQRQILKGHYFGYDIKDEQSINKLGYFNKFGNLYINNLLKNKNKSKIKP